jgi:hypothetical protein
LVSVKFGGSNFIGSSTRPLSQLSGAIAKPVPPRSSRREHPSTGKILTGGDWKTIGSGCCLAGFGEQTTVTLLSFCDTGHKLGVVKKAGREAMCDSETGV